MFAFVRAPLSVCVCFCAFVSRVCAFVPACLQTKFNTNHGDKWQATVTGEAKTVHEWTIDGRDGQYCVRQHHHHRETQTGQGQGQGQRCVCGLRLALMVVG